MQNSEIAKKGFTHEKTDLALIKSYKTDFGPDTYSPWKENCASDKIDDIINIQSRFGRDDIPSQMI